MAELSEKEQQFVVTSLASFVRPARIQQELKAEGVAVSLSQIAYYNPANAASRDLSPDLQALFEATRKRFLESEAEIGITHQIVRLRALDDLLDHEFVQMSPTLQMQVLEQAAKERGGMYNQRINGAKPDEVNDHVDRQMMKVRAAITQALPEAADQQRVFDAIHQQLSGNGLASGSEPDRQ